MGCMLEECVLFSVHAASLQVIEFDLLIYGLYKSIILFISGCVLKFNLNSLA